MLDLARLSRLIGNFRPHQVYHLAALANPVESLDRPTEYFRTNVQGTVNLLEALRIHNLVARILLVSLSEVYREDQEGGPLRESAPLLPRTPYGCSKMLSEEVGRHYWNTYGSRVVIARPFNHAGPGQRQDFVVVDFCEQIARAEWEAERSACSVRNILVGDLTRVRDFLDVRDVACAYVGLAEEGVEGETYNVCSQVETRIGTILHTALASARVKIGAKRSPEKCRISELEFVIGDNHKLLTLLDWTPNYSLVRTVTDTLDEWRVSVEEAVSSG